MARPTGTDSLVETHPVPGSRVAAAWMPDSPVQTFSIPAILCLYLTGDLTVPVAGAVLALQVVVNYAFAWSRYHWENRCRAETGPRLPPKYPTFIPFIGSALSILWEHSDFVRRISSYGGNLTASRVYILGRDVYFFQDRQTIKAIFKQAPLSSAIALYTYTNHVVLGIRGKPHAIYRADDSGPFPKPHPSSHVLPHNRIDYLTHNGLIRGLTGPGLHPTTLRYIKDVSRRFQTLQLTGEWTELDDFARLFRDNVGAAALQSLFGPTILRINPSFFDDLWEFDTHFPRFTKMTPTSKGRRIRESLVDQMKKWYKYAREHFDESKISHDGDGDPFWGSGLLRHRQETLLQVDEQGDDGVARADVGLAWATIGNMVLSAMFMAFHVFRDAELLARVRGVVKQHVGEDSTMAEIDHKELVGDPLLSSIYAEILRLYIKVYSAFMSPHEDVLLGKWWLPRGSMAVVNSAPSHMDAEFWNTRNGKFPVESFWAERFLVDPSDPSSGPIRPECRCKESLDADKSERTEPYFSTDGCEASWIPYGGGYSMCAGRFLAKNVMVFTCALLVHEYDVQLDDTSIQFTKGRFGIGVEEVKNPLPFRMRKRMRETN